MLRQATSDYPTLPTVDKPAPTILDVPWVVEPWQVGPEGDPGSGGPKWDWTKIGLLVGIGALLATTLTSSGPLPTPQPAPTLLPTPVSTPVPTPDSDPQHRGRLQIQGKDMRRGEISWPWAQSTPPTKAVALTQLQILWGQLSKSEQKLRTKAYQDAQKFIQGGPYYAHLSKTFQDPNLPPKNKDSARIDIEIRKGMAFVNQ